MFRFTGLLRENFYGKKSCLVPYSGHDIGLLLDAVSGGAVPC